MSDDLGLWHYRAMYDRLRITQQMMKNRTSPGQEPLHADEFVIKISRSEYEYLIDLSLEALVAKISAAQNDE